MTRGTLYPDEKPTVHRHSSLEQYKGFLSVMIKGGWSPIVFDQLDGINCETVNFHPVVISWGDDIGYEFSDAECSYASEKFIYLDKEGVEQKLLPECYGGGGEFYEQFIKRNIFVNFDDASLGVRNKTKLRIGMSYVLADETLPADD